jgi:hypothetical protein
MQLSYLSRVLLKCVARIVRLPAAIVSDFPVVVDAPCGYSEVSNVVLGTSKMPRILLTMGLLVYSAILTMILRARHAYCGSVIMVLDNN